MTKVQSWTLSFFAMVALTAGVLMMTGAVSSAQEGTSTPTPAASSGPDDGDTETATPEATDDADSDGTDGRADDGTDKDGDGRNCPHEDDSETDDGTSGTTTSA